MKKAGVNDSGTARHAAFDGNHLGVEDLTFRSPPPDVLRRPDEP